MNSRILGIIGAILLIVGIFVPIVSVFGISVSYFDSFRMSSGAVDGLIIAGLGLISLILAALNKTRILIATGILALCVMAIDFFSFKSKMSEAASAASSPEMANLMQLQWGWGVLLLGALLLIVAGIMKKSGPAPVPSYGTPPPPPYNPGQPPPPPPYNR